VLADVRGLDEAREALGVGTGRGGRDDTKDQASAISTPRSDLRTESVSFEEGLERDRKELATCMRWRRPPLV
jgi:hypothetical protein